MAETPKSKVLRFLEEYKDRDGECTPSIQQICRAVSLSPKTVFKQLRQLEEAGVIEREQRWQAWEDSYGEDYRWPPAMVRVSNLYRIARVLVLVVSLAGLAYYVNFRKWLKSLTPRWSEGCA